MEDAYIIKGGKALRGKIKLSGAKNVALKVIIAALLFDQKVIFDNIPRIIDVFELMKLIRSLGGKAEFIGKNQVEIDGRGINKERVDFFYSSKIRVSFMLMAPLLYKFRRCYVPNPGGCRIGARPIDRTIAGMRQLGININYDPLTGYYEAKMINKPRGTYKFEKSSHTGTELLILISLFGQEKIIIDNAAQEPEIDDLINFLNLSGARIKRINKKVVIEPVKTLSQKDPYSIISDRNEAVTYATLALATKGEVTIPAMKEFLISEFIKKLQQAGAGVKKLSNDGFHFYYQNQLKSVDVETSPYPGFMTDWQPNWSVLMTQAQGTSIIKERVFENRFAYVEELRKLGAQIDFIDLSVSQPEKYFFFNFDRQKKYQQAIKIKGPQKLHSGVLNIADLRAGANLVIAAFLTPDETIVNGASILERGYEDFVEKVRSLNGEIKKI
ncbi:MAG: UDP-N-acetylglucosamine 1-carboxyvinyltransferase [Microgenomates group bacterium]|nr:UDP-N-acetylglucosamine 1-carboxyvinyltransferase [Microgenomates group bacterium]